MFFTHFASTSQVPGFSINRTLVINRLNVYLKLLSCFLNVETFLVYFIIYSPDNIVQESINTFSNNTISNKYLFTKSAKKEPSKLYIVIKKRWQKRRPNVLNKDILCVFTIRHKDILNASSGDTAFIYYSCRIFIL